MRVTYFMKDDEDQSYIAQEPCDMLNTIEYELFRVRVKQYIIVVTLREYIQESIKGALEAMANPP